MIVGYVDFTPETLGYKGKNDKHNMVDVPLSFGGISYRCTCVEFLGRIYCVMPFRKVTNELACSMAAKVEKAHYFARPVNTIIAQIIDRHNMIVEYSQCFDSGDSYVDIREIACASVGAMCKMGYIEKDVCVEYQGRKFNTRVDAQGRVGC